MKIRFLSFLPAIALMAALAGGAADAAIQLSGTRVIMNEKDRNVSIFAKNLTTAPFVVQAWIDGEAEEMQTPFFITPPLSRFDANAERSLNITRVGGGQLPGDRESYYWVNVLEIPQKTDAAQNSLTLATRTRIKLFYRPTAVLQLPRGPELVKWALVRDGKNCGIDIQNGSAYNMNFARIDTTGEPSGFGTAVVAKPLASTRVALGKCPAGAIKLAPHVVNDYGVVEPWPEISLQ
ncbi:fimbrial chaperone protein [Achromobacter sp. Root83]|uniref:fimbrial biogenesis chaperone n=1 Tax=Achromobacter sp. Root83 TaxID=1736602 RepID=UPI0007090DB9|nr:molecular chaperone [Achromobacter sp. Root83]KRC72968.1 fimbrial chaperone protein [Achromobacter sp. Root83]